MSNPDVVPVYDFSKLVSSIGCTNNEDTAQTSDQDLYDLQRNRSSRRICSSESELSHSSYLSNRIRNIQISNYNKCSCGGQMLKNETYNAMICELCGTGDELIGSNIEDSAAGVSAMSRSSYNTSSDSAAPIKVSGQGGGYLQRRLISRTSEYHNVQRKDTYNQILNITKKCSNIFIPDNLAQETADIYYSIQVLGKIQRGNVRKGIMAACLAKVCEKSMKSITRVDLCIMFEIQLSDLSNGEKLLSEFLSNGLVDKHRFSQSTEAFDNRIRADLVKYFINLRIPIPSTISIVELNFTPVDFGIKYFEFAESIIRFGDVHRIAVTSSPKSKCAGVIWILACRCPNLNIAVDNIQSKCQTTPGTFKKYGNSFDNIIMSNDPTKSVVKGKLIRLFNTYNISVMPK